MHFRNFLLRALSPEDLVALLPSMQEVILPVGHIVYRRDDDVNAIYFPNTAVLSIVTALQDGRRVESATIGLESAVGLLPVLSEQPASSDVLAQIGGVATRLDADSLRRRALSHPALMRTLLRFAHANLAQAEQAVACNALHDINSRLAKWLLETNDRVGGDIVPLTQEYLSVMVGVQRASISVEAAKMQSSGLIRYTRGKIEILDVAGLKLRACECYARSHQAFSRLAPPLMVDAAAFDLLDRADGA